MLTKKTKRKSVGKKHPKWQKTLLTYLPLGILILGLIIILYQIGTVQNLNTKASTTTNCSVRASDLALDSEEQNFLTLLNQYRATKGAPAVKFSSILIQSSSWMTRDMITSGKLDHVDSFGRDPFARVANCGYTNAGSGENILYGDTTAADALKTWQSDKGHDDNLIDPSWKVIGVARLQAANGMWYWTYDAGDTDDSQIVVSPTIDTATIQPTLSATVPSPGCLGSCPPGIVVSPTEISATISPTNSVSEMPSITGGQPTESPTTGPSQPSIFPTAGAGGTPGGGQGFFGFLLGLLLLVLQFFAQLFGGK